MKANLTLALLRFLLCTALPESAHGRESAELESGHGPNETVREPCVDACKQRKGMIKCTLYAMPSCSALLFCF